jgi:hypothetical protein
MAKVSRTGVTWGNSDLKLLGLLGASLLTVWLWQQGYQRTACFTGGAAVVLGADTFMEK